MKVITEERLRYVLKNHFGIDDVNSALCSHLCNELEEIDTLTVSKLRPMSEARDEEFVFDKSILVVSYVDSPGVFHVVEQNGSNYWSDGEDDYCSDSEFIGWIPMPIYKPEQP